MKIRLKGLAAGMSALAVFAAAAGVTGAYLTQTTEKADNLITRGTIEVRVTEPEWSPEKGKGLTPGSVIAKDPTAVNTGRNDAWVFLRAEIPVKMISLVDETTKRKQEAAEVELFSFAAADQWELVEKTAEKDRVCYIYGYRTVLKTGEKTAPLFHEVKLVNYLEGELDERDILTIPIEAMSIQADVCPRGTALKTVYGEYIRQKERA